MVTIPTGKWKIYEEKATSQYVKTMGCASSKEVIYVSVPIYEQLPVVEKQQEERKEDILPQQPLQENKKLAISDFELLKTIGQGSFGKVFQVVNYETK